MLLPVSQAQALRSRYLAFPGSGATSLPVPIFHQFQTIGHGVRGPCQWSSLSLPNTISHVPAYGSSHFSHPPPPSAWNSLFFPAILNVTPFSTWAQAQVHFPWESCDFFQPWLLILKGSQPLQNGGHAVWLRWQLSCCMYVLCSLKETLSSTRAEAKRWVSLIRPHYVFTMLGPRVCSHTHFQFIRDSQILTYGDAHIHVTVLDISVGSIDQSQLGHICVWHVHIYLHILML